MREIKFKVWDKESKTMSQIGAIDWDSNFEVITCNTKTNKLYTGYDEDTNFILLQYTGLKDKNGIEIYEGDIVKVNSGLIAKVVWDRWCFGYYLYWICKHGGVYPFGQECEVIGNIYNNPELLTP